MSGVKIANRDAMIIKNLKRQGFSINEIRNLTGKGYGTVFRYSKNVEVMPKYLASWLSKRGGNKKIAENKWISARAEAKRLIKSLDGVSRLLILASLYWGEGTKKGDFCITNSDPELIKVFLVCLSQLDVGIDRLRVSIRIYEDIDKSEAIKFWSKIIGISEKDIVSVNVLAGRKVGKLKYGMCRLRISKGEALMKKVLSIIQVIIEICSRRSTDRTWVS